MGIDFSELTCGLDNDEIIFRTANGAKLAAALRQSVVAFEVDEIDLRTRTGWSVVCLGQAYEITDSDRLAALREKMPEPWVEDHTTHTIAIPLHTITGRRLAVHNGINVDLFVRPHGARQMKDKDRRPAPAFHSSSVRSLGRGERH